MPSKRGVPYERQPLRRALCQVEALDSQLSQLLRHTGEPVDRFCYNPAAFEPTMDVEGERIVLI